MTSKNIIEDIETGPAKPEYTPDDEARLGYLLGELRGVDHDQGVLNVWGDWGYRFEDARDGGRDTTALELLGFGAVLASLSDVGLRTNLLRTQKHAVRLNQEDLSLVEELLDNLSRVAVTYEAKPVGFVGAECLSQVDGFNKSVVNLPQHAHSAGYLELISLGVGARYVEDETLKGDLLKQIQNDFGGQQDPKG